MQDDIFVSYMPYKFYLFKIRLASLQLLILHLTKFFHYLLVSILNICIFKLQIIDGLFILQYPTIYIALELIKHGLAILVLHFKLTHRLSLSF